MIICKGTGGNGNKNTSGVHPNYSIIMIGENTEKNLGAVRDLLPLKLQ